MGGHQGGDIASIMAVSHSEHDFMKAGFVAAEMTKKWLQVQLKLENETVLCAADRLPGLSGMGTTMVLAIRFENNALIAHLDGSRACLYFRGRFTQLAEDHLLASELVKLRQITREQTRNHPQKSIITQALAVSSTISPEFNRPIIQENDVTSLCTDDSTSSLRDDQIRQILAAKSLSLDGRCKKLITEANRPDGGDNIAVCLFLYRAGDRR